MNLAGTISGASGVFAQARLVHEFSGSKSITASDLNAWKAESEAFMANNDAIEGRLLAQIKPMGWDASQFHLQPALDIQSAGSMALASQWDLSAWRFGGEPGQLTLRTPGNLNINENLVDHPTPVNSLFSSTAKTSWRVSLVAGADLAAADPLAVVDGVGDLKVADGRMVYTESAALDFASGRDTILGPGSPTGYMVDQGIRYSVGSYEGTVQGRVGRDLIVRGGAVQTSTGNIELEVGRNLILDEAQDFGSTSQFKSVGAIRTLGESPTGAGGRTTYWKYANGGDIRVDVGGAVTSRLASNAWDFAYGSVPPRKWAASYEGNNTTEAIASLGGGDVEIVVAGDFLAQAGTFGKGDFALYAGGDVFGRFLIHEGVGEIASGGNFGNASSPQVLELFDARASVTAQGEIYLGSVVNPTIARTGFSGRWDLQYQPETSVRFNARTGDFTFIGDSPFYSLAASQARLEKVLPATFEVDAGGDILIRSELALAPGSLGNLRLSAQGDIDGGFLVSSGGLLVEKQSLMVMSDADPAESYGIQQGFSVSNFFNKYIHADGPLHLEDHTAAQVTAGGEIRNLQLVIPKDVEIAAGKNIRNLYLFGQNVREDSVTSVKAGGSILMSSGLASGFITGMEIGGPGTVFLEAGDSIDLGTSRGIQALGNALNLSLPQNGSQIFVVAGYDKTFEHQDMEEFFVSLRDAGTQFSTLLADGKADEAETYIEQIRSELIQPFLGEGTGKGSGNLDMVSSQISTNGADEGIFVFARENINVGRSAFFANESERKNTGIFTSTGGSINLYAGNDINVNESRVMAFRGGDITAWSDLGSINAGRGSKTSISVSPPKLVSPSPGVYVLAFDPPAVGSGIRALTYDPDGAEGPLREPPAGDIYLFAPSGAIDAGEAGIAGSRVVLGASHIINANNISFTTGAVGIPSSAAAAGSIGSLSGASSAAQQVNAENAVAVANSNRTPQTMTEQVQELIAKWLDVKVISFDVEATDTSDGNDEERS
ncbi:MAG: filamentous hemagglutinin family protein [Syntrophobacteraceae bacterium]